jgi:hypothetical protein
MNLEDLAKRIREACLEAIVQAYEDAGMQGLCADGRWEVAVGALRTLDLTSVLRDFSSPQRKILGTSDSAGTDEKIRFQVIIETVSQFVRSRLAASAQCIDCRVRDEWERCRRE